MQATERTAVSEDALPFVYIVESPSPRDLSDGRTEGRGLCEMFSLSKTKHAYTLAVNVDEFLRAFSVSDAYSPLSQAISRFGVAPIVHLSMHGSEDGVTLTDGTNLRWDHLRDILSPLNDFLPSGLFVNFSTCGGAASIRMSMRAGDHEKPFYATIGSIDAVPWDDALVAYAVFYHNWFKHKPTEQCVELMKLASGHDGFAVHTGASQKQAYIEYVKKRQLIEALGGAQ
jgi:hypothetical protein